MNIQLTSLLTAQVTGMATNPIINDKNGAALSLVNVAPINNRENPPPLIQTIAMINRLIISNNLSTITSCHNH
tara:strand:- start:1830 stop:2048 length:219 start_codon:yes stop_codon:yes gene_type:complete